MGKRMDITDKLNFDENPVIVVKGVEIEVEDDAATVLKLLGMIQDSQDGEARADVLAGMARLLFTKEGKKNLDALKLNIADYNRVIEAAMDLVTGDGEEENPQKASTISSTTGI